MALTLELYDESSCSWSDKTNKCVSFRHRVSGHELELIEFELIEENVNVGQRVRVRKNDNIIFEGVIYERSLRQRKGLLSVRAIAYSYLILYDRQIIYRIYQSGVKAGEIIRDLAKLIDDEISVNLIGVEDGDALLSPWKIENCSALEIMRNVAKGTNYWLRMKPCLSYLEFDGYNDRIIIPSPLVGANPFTIEACVNISTYESNDRGQMIIGNYRGRYRGFCFTIAPYSGKPRLYVGRQSDTIQVYATSSIPLELNKWYVLFGIYDGTYARVYIGNELTGEKEFHPIEAETADTWIGQGQWAFAEGKPFCYLTGKIAYIRVYDNKALNEDEREHNLNNPFSPITENLVLWFSGVRFENNTVLDLSENGNYGTAYGGVSQGHEVYPKYVNSMLLEFKPKVIT